MVGISGKEYRQLDEAIVPKSFPCGSAGKESTCNVGDLGSIPALGRSPEEGKSHPTQYSGLENSMDYIVHGVAKSWTQLSDFHFTSHCTQVEMEQEPMVLAPHVFCLPFISGKT